MADLTLRNNKGTALTFDEMDSNFLALDSDITDIKVGASQYVTLSTPQTITGSKYFNTSTSFDSVVILETLSLGGPGSQFVSWPEDTVKLKFVTEYTSNTIQAGMGHISDELWLASIDSADSTGVRRIGFYLDVPDGGALDAASQSASTNARVYITLSGMTVKGLLSGDSANFSGKVTANEFHGDGSNLTGVTSYVKADFDSDFGTKSTSDLTEGTNLYYTSSRADSDAKNAISVSGSLSYDPVTGIISYTDVDSDRTVTQIRGLFSAAGDLSYDSSTGKFTNTYVDSERTVAQIRGMFNAGGDLSYDSSTGKFSFTESPTYTTSDFDSDFNTKSTSNLSEGANKYYRTVYFDSDLGDKNTDNLAEGSNLYYTTARADSDAKNAISAGGDLSYNPATGVVSYTDSDRTPVQIRGLFSAGGDLSYNSSTGEFTFTERTNDSVRALFSASGDLSYNSSTGQFSYTDSDRTPGQIRGLFSAAGDLSYNSSTGEFSYSQRTDSAVRVLISASGDLSYNADTGVMSYTDSARSADQIKGLFSAGGDLSFNPTTGVFSYSERTDSAVRLLISAAGDLSYDANTGVISYTDSDRSAAQIKGLFSAAGSLSYNSTTGEFSYTDSDRTASQIKGLFSASGDLSYNSTTGEFSYTDSERTVAQIRGMFNAGGDLSYDSALGKFSFTQTLYSKANFDSDFGAKTTSDLTEGTNLYYTTARFDSDFGDNTTDNLTEGSTNLYYTTARANTDFDTRLATKSTTDLTEGTNLYYTTARADSDAKNAVSATDAGGDGSFSYNSSTGVFTYTGPSASEVRAHFSGGTGVTISSGSISIGQPVATTDNVTFAQTTMDSAIVDGINFNHLTSRHTNTAGTLYFDSDHQKALSLVLDTQNNPNPDVTLNIGQEIVLYAHNLTGAAINKGDAVYISGTAHGKHPQISLARANVSTTGNPTGLATMDIPDGAHGWVTRYGIVRDVNTGDFAAGSTLYLSADSAGKWTSTEVTVDTGYPFHIGTVLTSDSTAGTILVDGFSEHYEYLRIEDRLKVSGRLEADSASLLNVQFNTTRFDSHQSYSEGLLYYDNAHKTLNYNDDITGMIHEIGIQEHQRVFNNTGSLIRKGSALYFSGNYTSGIIDVPTVGLADATDVNAYNAQGIAAQDIANNSYGHCLIAGQLTEVNTSHLSAGTNFFVSATTPGSHQNASPVYPNYPMCLGWVVLSGDSNTGILLVNQQNHSVNSFRVRTSAHIGTDLQVDGDLTVLGSQTTVGTTNVTQGAPFYRLNEGDTIGEANTTFQGSGLDDAFFGGHFQGTTSTDFYVKIDATGTPDTFEWGYDSASPQATGISITGSPQALSDNINIEFATTTGHTVGDKWLGTAAPVNVDTGFFTNRNTGGTGVGYTHMGIFFDVSDEKWKLVDEYDSTPTGTINTGDASFGLATLVAETFEGNLTGTVTGNASSATQLASGRNFQLSGQITSPAVSFDGTSNVTLVANIAAGVIKDSDISATANIADTKLATISTASKVSNSATTATDANTGSAIVARDASGNFSAGTITASLTGTASNASQLNSQSPSYYRIDVYDRNGTLLN